MTIASSVPLLEWLRCPNWVAQADPENVNWELLLRQSRAANLVSRLAVEVIAQPWFGNLHPRPRQHFENAYKVWKASARAARWEIADTHRILNKAGHPFVLLKGAAYIQLGNDASKGRLFGDTDILVQKERLEAVEISLIREGWVPTKLDAYDQRYYREWAHELPPLHHLRRQTTLDVHHDILPPIVETGFRIECFWKEARELEGFPGMFVLCDEDMILHSATHLFHEGEFENGLRDLVDLDSLLREYMKKRGNLEKLVQRAKVLCLHPYLFYALKLTNEILATPVPDAILREFDSLPNAERWAMTFWLKWYRRALLPLHETISNPGTEMARFLLYIRSHWIRMPLKMLIPHLWRKAMTQ